MIFVSPEYASQEILEILAQALKPKRLVGSSTGVVILPDGAAPHGIALVGINSDEMKFGISAVMDINNLDMRHTGFELAKKAGGDLETSTRDIFITFSAGIEKDTYRVYPWGREMLGGGFPVSGAISSDHFKYKELNQFFQDQILQNSTVGVLLGGTFAITFVGSKHGFKPLGKPRGVHSSGRTLIRMIDHQPAVDIYRHFLGPKADQLKNMGLNSPAARYPLGVYLEEDRQYLLRNIVDILEDGHIVCQEGIPQGG